MTFVIFVVGATCWAGPSGPSPEAHQAYLKSLLYESQGNLTAAQEELERAVSLSPNSAHLFNELAELDFRQGKFPQASEAIEKAIAIDPKNPKYHILAGQVYWAMGDAKKAEEVLTKAVKLAPEEAEALVNLAMTVAAKDPERALKLYENYLNRYPAEIDIQERVAQLYHGMGNLEKAEVAWEKVLDFEPDNLRANLATAQIAEVNHDTSTAIVHYERVLDLDPTNLPLLLRIGELRYRSDQLKEAQEAFLKAQAVAPDSASANFWLALLSEQKGDWDEAIKLLKQVVSKTPEPSVMLRLSYYYSQKGEQKEAIKILEKLSKDEPENTDFLNYLSLAYEQNKQYPQAEKIILRHIDVDPNNPEPYFHLATVYDRMNKFNAAEQQLKKAIEVNPKFHIALNYLGYSYAEKNTKLDMAEKLVSEALGLDPNNGAYLDSMGWVNYRLGKYEKAREFLMYATQQANDPLIWEHLGDVYAAEKNAQAAVVSFDKALRMVPDIKTISPKIEKLLSSLDDPQKAQLLLNRTGSFFKDLLSLEGMVKIKVGFAKPIFQSRGDFNYLQGKTMKLEIPGPLAAPYFLVVKISTQSAQFGAIHSSLLGVEPYAKKFFDQFYSVLSSSLFTRLSALPTNLSLSTEKFALLLSSQNTVLTFDKKSGMLQKISFSDSSATEMMFFYDTKKNSSLLPSKIEWKESANNFSLSLEFANPLFLFPKVSEKQ